MQRSEPENRKTEFRIQNSEYRDSRKSLQERQGFSEDSDSRVVYSVSATLQEIGNIESGAFSHNGRSSYSAPAAPG